MLSPLFSLCPCDLTRMDLLCKGTFLCVVCLYRWWAPLPGNVQGCRADLDRERETQVPKEQEDRATEQDPSSPCSAPNAGASSSHPDLQSSLHAKAPAGACFPQDFPWSCSPPFLTGKRVISPSTGEEGSLGTKAESPSHPSSPSLLVEGQKWSSGCCPPIPEKRQCQPSPSKNRGEALCDSTLKIPIKSH